MARYKEEIITDKKVWEEFVLSRNPRSFLQSWNWGKTNESIGDEVVRWGYYKDDELVGVCQMIKQTARRGPHFLVPAGPVIDWNDKGLVKFVFGKIRDYARSQGSWFVRIRPELEDNEKNSSLFKSLGLIPAPMHLHAENTYVLNIDKDDEELLYGMRKNTRYSVRKSLRYGLGIEKTSSIKSAEILEKLQDETVRRLGFVGFSGKLFKAQLQTFGKDGQALMFICRKGSIPLVASIIIFYGDFAYYHHSGSSSKYREIPASYFLQWHVINEARRRGCRFYDMWGAVPKGKTKHRFSGPSLFKKGFGGERVDWLHAHDMPIRNTLYWGTYLFETIRKRLRGL